MTDTKTILDGMLKEHTGRHFLDSGGENGRAWQQNQGREFEREPHSTLSWRWGLELTHNVYHWLNERLDYSPEWQERFNTFAALPENADDSWLALMDVFFDEMRRQGHTVAGIYGEGDPVTVNTYNHDSLLSQTIQFIYAMVDDEDVVLLQVHGGADARGGYTAPKAFVCNGNYDLGIFDDSRGGIYCDGMDCDANWYTDDGHNFYFDGGTAGTKLNEYAIVKHGDGHGDITEITAPAKGIVYVDEDGHGHCPACGIGILLGSV